MAGVNPALIEQISEYVLSLRDAGTTFLVVEHNLSVVSALCDQLVVISAGQVLRRGITGEVLEDALVREAFLGN
jgi:branched-chain amino acid transport system ATP-binding protein